MPGHCACILHSDNIIARSHADEGFKIIYHKSNDGTIGAVEMSYGRNTCRAIGSKNTNRAAGNFDGNNRTPVGLNSRKIRCGNFANSQVAFYYNR